MTSSSTFGRRRIASLAVLLVMLTGAFALISPAEAQSYYIIEYYTDATHTTVVGQYGYDCVGNRIAWGVRTPYYVVKYYCAPSPPLALKMNEAFSRQC